MEETDKPTVLVVDDEAEWRDFLQATLSPRYRVRAATSGKDGLAAGY